MKIGIIGRPQSGKTTLLKILLQEDIAGNIGVYKDTDERVKKIGGFFSSKKTSYPEFTFINFGPIANFDKKDLSKLQDVDLFVCVVGAFFSDNLKKDFESSITDIVVTDLELVQNRIARLNKEARPEKERELKTLEKCQALLSEEKLLYMAGIDDELKMLSGLFFLSSMPLLLAINIPDQIPDDLENKIKALEEYCVLKDMACLRFQGKTELEVLELDLEERRSFLKDIGIKCNLNERISGLIKKEMNLITFFTAGNKEARGWYLKSGLPVIKAAGKIHSDMERGFIRAEVVNYEDFAKYGAIHKAREAGMLKVEGKDYIVKDGDIINIRFNV